MLVYSACACKTCAIQLDEHKMFLFYCLLLSCHVIFESHFFFFFFVVVHVLW
jgi:hypothetical protein